MAKMNVKKNKLNMYLNKEVIEPLECIGVFGLTLCMQWPRYT